MNYIWLHFLVCILAFCFRKLFTWMTSDLDWLFLFSPLSFPKASSISKSVASDVKELKTSQVSKIGF